MHHYLNNAGASIPSPGTLDAMYAHFELERRVGAMRAATEAKQVVEAFYGHVASLVGAGSPDEVAFVDSTSRAWNLLLEANVPKGGTIVTLSSEFGSNLLAATLSAERAGASVSIIRCEPDGTFDFEQLVDILSSRTNVIVAVSHAAAHGSIVNPVAKIGDIARKLGAIYIVDGCQAAGQLPVDVPAIQCHAYAASGRKWLRGPRGSGFLYVRAGSCLRSPQVDLAAADLIIDSAGGIRGLTVRDDARRFEMWERSLAVQIGLSNAIGEYLAIDSDNVSARIRAHATQLRHAVHVNPALQLVGQEESSSGVVGFCAREASAEESIGRALTESEIVHSEMHDWDCPLHFPSHGVQKIFRFSPHHDTRPETLQYACDVLGALR